MAAGLVSLHVAGMRLTSELVIGVPTGRVGPREGPPSVDYVGTHTRWCGITDSRVPSGQCLGRSTQQYLSQWKCSRPAYLTLQLGARSGADQPWKSSIKEAAQILGSSPTTLIPAATTPQSPATA